MTDSNSELREFSRVPFKMVADLKVGDLDCPVANIRDLSMKGIFLECDVSLEKGAVCQVNLKLEGVEPPVEIMVQGEIQRIEKSGYGISFSQIQLESYEHLNHIVQLNAKNPHQSEDEIKSHLGLNPR